MRTETDQQESKPKTRRGQGAGRKQPAARKPSQKAPARKNPARASNSRAQSRSTNPRTHEAEEAVDRIAEQVGHFASIVGHEVLRAAARAREEIEDMVAEAQSIRDSLLSPSQSHRD